MKTWKKVALWILGLLVVLILVSYLLPKSYKVERSITVKSTPHTLYMLISDYRLWELWAPWTKEEDPAVVFEIEGTPGQPGSVWKWKGDKFRQGAMTMTEGIPVRRMTYQLDFDQGSMISYGLMELECSGDSCRVTWRDEGTLGNFPLERFFGLLADRMMGPDFEKGLMNLKAIAEARAEWPEIKETVWPAHTFLAITDSAGPENYAMVMGKAYSELMQLARKENLQVTGAPFAKYIRWDSVTMFSVMDLGIPVATAESVGGRARVVHYPELKVVLVHYFGPYEKTAPMYHVLDQYVKETGLKEAEGPWEIYITGPDTERDTARWETVIAFPVKD